MTATPPVGARQEPAEPARQASVRTPRRRRRRWPIVVLVVLIVLVALAVVALIVGDGIFRDRAEAQIETSVETSLPSGVTGSATAEIGGFSALQQWLAGSFQQVTVTMHDLTIEGAPASATLDLRGLPVNGGSVSSATADLTVGQAAFRDLPALEKVNASSPTLGSGTISTSLTESFLGVSVVVKVVLTPSLLDQVVHLAPTSATLTAGPASVPATAIVQQLLPNGIDVCAAQYLPEDVRLTNLAVKKGEVQATLQARDLDLTRLDTERKGTCS